MLDPRSEHALKKLEEEVEELNDELKKKIDNEIIVMEEKESLKSELEDSEQAIENLNSLTRSLNKKLLHYEEKQVDLGDLPATDQPCTEESVCTGRQNDNEGEENNPDSTG